MTYRMALHHRRSIRLRGYDYTQAGANFVTVCTQDRACLLGEVVDGAMRLNEAGAMVQAIWEAIPAHYPGVKVDEFVAMPNHVHGIIVLTGVVHVRQLEGQVRQLDGQAQGPAPTNTGGDVAAGTGGDKSATNDDTATAGGHNIATGTLPARAAGQAQGPAPTNMGGDVAAGTGGDKSATNDDMATSGGDNRATGTLAARVAGQAQGPAPTNIGGDVASGTGGDKPATNGDTATAGGDNHATNGDTATAGGDNHPTNDDMATSGGDNHATGTSDVGAAPCGRPPLSPMSVGDIMQRFKSLTTRRYSDGVRESGWPEFRGRLWQRNYHEHIIRNEADLNRIRQYIRDNPAQWAVDSEYLADGTGPRQVER